MPDDVKAACREAKLRELAARWEERARYHGLDSGFGLGLASCADDLLAALAAAQETP